MRTLAIIGVGLIGGSIALAARSRGVVDRVVGADVDADSLETARQRCRLDECFTSVALAVKNADVIVVCTPVDQIVDQVILAAGVCPADALLTDVGSAKAVIVGELSKRLPKGRRFIGSHPLAGSEKRGAGFAHERLFDGRVVVVTPVENTAATTLQAVTAFWEGLGARVVQMTPEDHDRALAYTSHLPHVVAATLAGTLPTAWRDLTATGFADTTRIAAGDPAMWAAICLQNREPVLQALGEMKGGLESFRTALQAGDRAAIEMFLTQGKRNRDALGS